MSGACPGSCLYNSLVGGPGRGGQGPPPRSSKDAASEHEVWLESEVSRLQAEYWRLQDVNDNMKNELFYLLSAPRRTVTNFSSFFDNPAGEEEDDDGKPAKRVTFGDEFNSIKEFGRESTLSSMGGQSRPEESEEDDQQPKLFRRLSPSTANIDADMDTFDVGPYPLKRFASSRSFVSQATGRMNNMVTEASALGMALPGRVMIYTLALGFAVFVLVATATHLGSHDDHGAPHLEAQDDHAAEAVAAHHRRLGTGPTRLMKNIAVTLSGCGLLTLLAHALRLPLIVGYILGGVLVGPLGLGIVESYVSMSKMSSLGLVFLLFMIGLELDVKALFTQLGKITVLTGLVSLPLTALFMMLFLVGFEGIGISFGEGAYAAQYCAFSGALASTMITVRALETELQVDSVHGRRTVGILICQNLWAVVLLALQSNIDNFSAGDLMATFLWLAALIVFALCYAKFIMPAALFYASKSVELMLVLSLAWCFFICVTAILPFVGLPMEMAALLAGIALASFPYSAEFNAKIKYIRDFFLILFFGSLGMMLPAPTWETLGGVFFTLAVLLGVRWIGVFLPSVALGSATRYAAMVTINLSQVGELALVLCSLGVSKGHIGQDTLLVMSIVFLVSGVATGRLIASNYRLYKLGECVIDKLRGRQPDTETAFGGARLVDAECDVILLGFHKIAYMLVGEFHAKTPDQLKNIHVIDFSQKVLSKLRDLGLTCTVGDIASTETLERAQKHQPSIVISTIPDMLLQGITNAGIIKNAKDVWPEAKVLVTADSPQEAKALYEAGADYVVRMAKLSAERLHDILADQSAAMSDSSQLKELFDNYKVRDNAMRGATRLLGEKLLG